MQISAVQHRPVLFSAAKPDKPTPQAPEVVVLGGLDGRPWKRDFHAVDTGKNLAIHEYVLPPETVKNWTELVTLHEFKGYHQHATPQQLVNTITDRHTLVLVSSTNPMDVEYTATIGPERREEYEVSRAFQGEDGLYLVRYVSKKPIEPEQEEKWQGLLKAVRVVRETPPPDRKLN